MKKKKKSISELYSKKEKKILIRVKDQTLSKELTTDSINILQDDLIEVTLKYENEFSLLINKSNILLSKILSTDIFDLEFLALVATYISTLNKIQTSEANDYLAMNYINELYKGLMESNAQIISEFIQREISDIVITKKSFIEETKAIGLNHLKKISKRIKEECLGVSIDTCTQINKSNTEGIKVILKTQIELCNKKLEQMLFETQKNTVKIMLVQTDKEVKENIYDAKITYHPILLRINVITGDNIVEKYLYEYISSLGEVDETPYDTRVKVRFNREKDYSYKELNALARERGFVLDRQNGDHGIFIKKTDFGEITTIIPQGRAIGKGLQLTILKSLEQ